MYSTSRHWQQSGSSRFFHPDCCLRERDYIHLKLSHFPVHKNQTSPKPEPRLDPIYRSIELAFPARSVSQTHRPRFGDPEPGPGFISQTETHTFSIHSQFQIKFWHMCMHHDCRLTRIRFLLPSASICHQLTAVRLYKNLHSTRHILTAQVKKLPVSL